MFHHLRRILLVLVIFVAAGLLYKQWRNSHGSYGLFDLLNPAPENAQHYTPGSGPLLKDGDLPGLAAFSTESAKLAEAVLPSVVSINTATVKRESVGFFLGYRNRVIPGLGSGVIVSKEGHIITNNHVIAGTNQILVTTNDQKTYRAEVVGADAQLDIAVVKIVGAQREFTPLSFGDSEAVKVGQVVFAVGNPFGFSGSVTQGIISATQRRLSDASLLQTDTVINPGNSGGPLVDIHGQIVGINVSIFTGDEKVHSWQGIGLAIPSNDARAALQAIMKQGPEQIGYLGIVLKQTAVAVGPGLGVILDQVQPDSPAETAGLRPGDVIAAINGKALESPDQVFLAIRATPPGRKMTFTILRGGQTLTLTAIIQPFPQS